MVKGFRDGSNLLYIPSEKCLYRLKCNRNYGEKDYICYQTILASPRMGKKKERKEDRNQCNARVRLLPGDKKCNRMKNSFHSSHKNHEQIMRDMKKINNMKEKCETIKTDFTEEASTISTRNIYQREIKRYI